MLLLFERAYFSPACFPPPLETHGLIFFYREAAREVVYGRGARATTMTYSDVLGYLTKADITEIIGNNMSLTK